jgi:hypothetical protein
MVLWLVVFIQVIKTQPKIRALDQTWERHHKVSAQLCFCDSFPRVISMFFSIRKLPTAGQQMCAVLCGEYVWHYRDRNHCQALHQSPSWRLIYPPHAGVPTTSNRARNDKRGGGGYDSITNPVGFCCVAGTAESRLQQWQQEVMLVSMTMTCTIVCTKAKQHFPCPVI